jgi:hypothetical protein
MAFLVRKISRSKWPSNGIETMEKEEIPADAISNCMKTQKNTLSTWEIDSLDKIEEAVLALVASAEHVDSIDIVSIEKNKMEACGLQIIETAGITPVPDLVDKHKDVSALTYKAIGEFANLILDELRHTNVRRFTKSELLKIISTAIENGRLDKSHLSKSIQSKLGA